MTVWSNDDRDFKHPLERRADDAYKNHRYPAMTTQHRKNLPACSLPAYLCLVSKQSVTTVSPRTELSRRSSEHLLRRLSKPSPTDGRMETLPSIYGTKFVPMT